MVRDWTLLRIGIIFYGLGNQMMSYLYYKARTELTGEKIYLWAPRHKPLADHNGYELDRLFGIKTVGPLLDRIFWQLYLHRDNRLVRRFVSVKRDNLSANLSAPRTGCKLIHFIMAGDKDKDFYTKYRRFTHSTARILIWNLVNGSTRFNKIREAVLFTLGVVTMSDIHPLTISVHRLITKTPSLKCKIELDEMFFSTYSPTT